MLIPLVSLVLTALTATAHLAGRPHRRHQELAQRVSGDVQLHKRFDSARWTFYDVGLGACGKNSQPGDFMVALNSAQYGGGYPGPNCFKSITMIANGKTTTAVILDECPGCPWGGLDLSRGLFQFFASESAGVIYGTWFFNDGSGGGTISPPPPPPPPPPPSPTWSPPAWTPWTPTTTWAPPTTLWTPSTTHTPSPSPPPPSQNNTSAHNSTTYSATPTSGINYASGVASGLGIPTGTIAPNPALLDNVDSLNQLVINLGGLVVAARAVIGL
ncbi:RlpA-like double-psi beta-barrel-containing domain containing protein [Amanita muscaria]